MSDHPDADSRRADFLAALIENDLLTRTDVRGLYGRGATFEAVVAAVDALALEEGRRDGATRIHFPPVLSRHELERSGYLASFPHLAGSVFGFGGNESDAVVLAERAANHEDWSSFLEAADVVLTPACCYPVYPWVAGAGPLPAGGRLIDVSGYCFRREPSSDPARMQSFRMHENVRIGEPDVVGAWHASWIERGLGILRSLGLDAEVVPANDPFFGRAGRILAKGQRDQELKLEVVCPISSEDPGAVLSVNAHLDHFGADFGITTADGGVAHTACVGFGLERVTLALLLQHGLEPARWPSAVRTLLWPRTAPLQ